MRESYISVYLYLMPIWRIRTNRSDFDNESITNYRNVHFCAEKDNRNPHETKRFSMMILTKCLDGYY